MSKKIILKNLRRTVTIQFGLSALVLVLCWLIGWFYPYTIGLVFTWMGVFILVVVGFVGFGGYLSGADDLTAFSLSGAGKMGSHINNLRKAGGERLAFIVFGLTNGFIPVFVGYLLQTLEQ